MFLFLIIPFFLYSYFDPIEECINNFERDVAILQLGTTTKEKTYSFIQKFPKTQHTIFEDNNPIDQSKMSALVTYFKEKNFENNPIILNKRLFTNDIASLASCEYFDITVLVGKTFYTQMLENKDDQYFTHLLQLSLFTFIECDPQSALFVLLEKQGPKAIYPLENGNCLFYFANSKDSLTKFHMKGELFHRTIISNYQQRVEIVNPDRLCNARVLQRPLGINLVNFCLLYGEYPCRKTLLKISKPKFFIGKENPCHPHEIYIHNQKISLACFKFPVPNERVIDFDLWKQFLQAKTKKQIVNLLYPSD